MARWLNAFRHWQRAGEVVHCAARCRPWWTLTRAYLGLGTVAYPFDIEPRPGLRLAVRDYHEAVTAWLMFCRDEYEVPADARTVLDVGANVGMFSLLASSAAPHCRIVAIEPFPQTFQRLEENLGRNHLTERVRRWPVAVLDQTGVVALPEYDVRLHTSLGLSGSAVTAAVAGPSALGLSGSAVTAAVTGPSAAILSWPDLRARLAHEAGMDEIDLVKMDIEGGEHELIADLTPDTLRGIARWQMEYHPNGSKERLFQALEGAGLRCVKDTPAGPNSGVAHFRRPDGLNH